MKRILLFLLMPVIMLSLASCFGKEKDITYTEDIFFNEDTLALYHLEDLPTPNFDNSRMNQEEPNVLYLNMSDAEFNAYCQAVAIYLLAREDVYYAGVMYDIHLFVGPLFIPMSYDVYIPLSDNVDELGETNKFAFAMESELTSGWVTNGMKQAYEISIYRTKQALEGDTSYTYNTYIEISEAKAVYEPCAKEHKYGEDFSYPVPNTDVVIDIYYCEYCGHQGQSDYYGGADTNAYSISITQGKECLEYECLRQYTVNPSGYAGLEQEIKVLKKDAIEYKVTVNGFELPVIYEEEYYLVYGFIMPQCDIEIKIEIVE